ncbi:uncharacterized protein B0H18DRAFT_982581 [Fomitopsis serialis]|uniref:uncharacterized protein n=1 Tax=Fomitopsis serialis TaxID=139415 RepID=UPI0020076F79|nr:uncharacterized protein B0H18DRAFT_982581 [Neoantrodia serialis]KAH9933895.1 hypothetical protein B0H18DRAFT_982581 [Neoantrodia serialis]
MGTTQLYFHRTNPLAYTLQAHSYPSCLPVYSILSKFAMSPPEPDGSQISTSDLILNTMFFPPVAVWMITGCDTNLFCNIILTCCAVVPGHIHAL